MQWPVYTCNLCMCTFNLVPRVSNRVGRRVLILSHLRGLEGWEEESPLIQCMWLCTHCACMTLGTNKMYFDLAAATHRGCSSEITPFPMGVGRNGNLHL